MTLSVRALTRTHPFRVDDGIRQEVLAAGGTSLRRWLEQAPSADADFPWRDGWMTPLLLNGPVGAKLTIVVLGDGFAWQDQGAYNSAVDNLLMNGVLANDFFAANRVAFNVLRINLVSNHSGCGTVTYSQNNTEITSHDTALGLLYNGDWNHGWVENGGITEARLARALRQWAPEHHLVIVLLNHPGNGARGGGGRAFLGMGVTWATMAHELGHAMGGLGDEYCKPPSSTGPGEYGEGNPTEPPEPNLTINTDRTTLKWAARVAGGTPLPTGTGACAGFTAPGQPAGWDNNQHVGLFEGGKGFNTKVFRPVINCRMRSNTPPFCPVCAAVMDSKTRPNLDDIPGPPAVAPAEGATVARTRGGYLRLVVRTEGAALRIAEAREIAGDFVQPDEVTEGLAHEVMVGDRRVAIGSHPDAGVIRSFSEPGPDGPVPHRIHREESFDFVVRVPKTALAGADPTTLAVHLLDVPPGHRMALTDPANTRNTLDVVRIASLSGPQRTDLPDALLRALAGPDRTAARPDSST